MNKTVIKFFTIADYEEEELWLRQMHQNGYKLVKMYIPCFYIFEECEKEDVIYRLDYRSYEPDDDYWQMLKDFGWEHFAHCLNWHYYRKKADQLENAEDGELFSDNASRVEMISSVIRTRMMPIIVIFLCCVAPNFGRYLSGEAFGPWDRFFMLFYSIMFVIYVYLICHCGLKLRKLKDKYSN